MPSEVLRIVRGVQKQGLTRCRTAVIETKLAQVVTEQPTRLEAITTSASGLMITGHSLWVENARSCPRIAAGIGETDAFRAQPVGTHVLGEFRPSFFLLRYLIVRPYCLLISSQQPLLIGSSSCSLESQVSRSSTSPSDGFRFSKVDSDNVHSTSASYISLQSS